MEKLQVRMILEILGRPPEHVSEALKMVVERIEKEPGVILNGATFHEPRKIKESEDLYTSFVELVLDVESMHKLWGLLFSYMPSNVEITSPEKLILRNDELTHAVNQLIQRLHDYDAITKNVVAEREILIKKLREVAPHLFREQQKTEQVVAEKPKKKQSPKKKKKSSR